MLYVAAIVVSTGMFALAGSAAAADAPLGSEGSETGTLAAPGASAGMATATESENDCVVVPGGAVVAAGGPVRCRRSSRSCRRHRKLQESRRRERQRRP